MSFVWLNGELLDESSAAISVRDTGLLHGAGVFTTMRAFNSRVFRLAQHLKRIRESSQILFVPLTHKDSVLEEAVNNLLAKNELQDARLRLTITRGQVTQDPTHGPHLRPTVLLTAAPIEPYPDEYYQKGMTAVLLDDQKLNPYDIQAGHKTLDYFSRLAALREANRRGAGEALWFNVHNYLQSGSISNVFMVKGGTLYTPPTNEELRDASVKDLTPYPKSNVLPGIVRGAILEFAESAGIATQRRAINVSDLLAADEIFITNSIMGVMPVCRLERQAVGNEQPGEVTRKLSDALAEASKG